VVTADMVQDSGLRTLLERFDALPMAPAPGGPIDASDPAKLESIERGWIREGWRGEGLWNPEDRGAEALRSLWTPFFQDTYRWIRSQARDTR